MKFSPLVLAVVFSAFVGSAMAQETFFAPDTDGCQTYMPYVWTDLAPGAKWQATVDLSHCTSTDLGSFLYYGYIASNTSADVVKKMDGMDLTVQNLSTGQVYSSTAPKNTPEYLFVQVDQPAQFRLTAANTGRKVCKVRFTWTTVTK